MQLEDAQRQFGDDVVGHVDAADGVQGRRLGTRMEPHLRIQRNGRLAQPLGSHVLEALLAVPVDHHSAVAQNRIIPILNERIFRSLNTLNSSSLRDLVNGRVFLLKRFDLFLYSFMFHS